VTSSNAVPARSGGSVDVPGTRLLELVAVVDTLRRSCPWDREQTHASLLRYLLEEAYEAAETIEDDDMPALREEIGDVLFQVLFHARIASERSAADGGFTIDDVADTLTAKLIRRHPHVFAGVSVASAADVNANWEEIKKAERAAKAGADGGSQAASALDGVPFGQPALSLAAQLQRRAARAGIIVPVGAAGSGAPDGAAGSDGETGLTGERLGAELMALVARAQQAGLDPEQELRGAARRFAGQVRDQEQASLFARAPSRCYEQAEVIDAVSGNHRNACLSDSANHEVHPPIPAAIAQRARAVTLVYLDPGREPAACWMFARD
jgi:NTP pyrophosphatase (non-canonical NTP hydrolase)